MKAGRQYLQASEELAGMARHLGTSSPGGVKNAVLIPMAKDIKSVMGTKGSIRRPIHLWGTSLH